MKNNIQKWLLLGIVSIFIVWVIAWTPKNPSYDPWPSGIITPYAGTTAPLGYLPCDGAAVSRTTYAALFNVVGLSAII